MSDKKSISYVIKLPDMPHVEFVLGQDLVSRLTTSEAAEEVKFMLLAGEQIEANWKAKVDTSNASTM